MDHLDDADLAAYLVDPDPADVYEDLGFRRRGVFKECQ